MQVIKTVWRYKKKTISHNNKCTRDLKTIALKPKHISLLVIEYQKIRMILKQYDIYYVFVICDNGCFDILIWLMLIKKYRQRKFHILLYCKYYTVYIIHMCISTIMALICKIFSLFSRYVIHHCSNLCYKVKLMLTKRVSNLLWKML